MMNRFFTLFLASSCLTAVGQVTYPYNPDGNADSLIGASDIQDLLSGYGLPFSPSEILVDGQTLTNVLTQLQNSIDSLSGLGGSGGSVLDMPLGTVLPIATESVPEGWMLCDGREISIEEYQGLYDLIGTTYGAGDSAFWAQVFFPATTFNIPDLRGRTIIGANDMGGEQSDVLTIHQASAGQVGGEEMHQLTEEEMPSHSHDVPISYGGGGQDFIFPVGSNWPPVGDSHPTSSVGGDQPHNNMQPYLALNYMMKVQPSDDALEVVMAEMESIATDLGSVETMLSNITQWLSEPEVVLFDFNETGDFTPLVIEAGLSSTVVVEAVGDSGYSIGELYLPSENVPEGFVARVVNTNFHGQGGYGIAVQPISPNSNNGSVKKGRVASFVFVGGYWYPPAKIN